MTKTAATKCKDTVGPCDGTLGTQCANFEKGVSPTTATAAKDCLESGVCGAGTCLTRAAKAAKPTQAHTDLATKYCSTCAPDLNPKDCTSQFFASKSKGAGVVVLPYPEAVATAVANACTTDPGTCRATFTTCANDTIATTLNGLVPPELASCITSSFQNDDTGTVPGSSSGTVPGTSGGPEVQACTPDNCKGCCKEDKCIDGTDAEACGKNGVVCQTCSTVQQCTTDGQCHEPCSPNNCQGCCDGDNCIPGDTTEKCGEAGAACTKCDATNKDLACDEHKCVDRSCKATCSSGCCSANGCELGTTAAACGTGAGACVKCGYGKQCSNHACALDPASLWDLAITAAVVPQKKLNGDYWDPFYQPPDPYVKVFTSLGATSHSGQTAYAKDTFSPTYTETPLKGISAQELMSNFSFEIWDDDVDYDDLIGGCRVGVSAAAFGGPVQSVTCAQTPSNPSVTLKFKINQH